MADQKSKTAAPGRRSLEELPPVVPRTGKKDAFGQAKPRHVSPEWLAGLRQGEAEDEQEGPATLAPAAAAGKISDLEPERRESVPSPELPRAVLPAPRNKVVATAPLNLPPLNFKPGQRSVVYGWVERYWALKKGLRAQVQALHVRSKVTVVPPELQKLTEENWERIAGEGATPGNDAAVPFWKRTLLGNGFSRWMFERNGRFEGVLGIGAVAASIAVSLTWNALTQMGRSMVQQTGETRQPAEGVVSAWGEARQFLGAEGPYLKSQWTTSPGENFAAMTQWYTELSGAGRDDASLSLAEAEEWGTIIYAQSNKNHFYHVLPMVRQAAGGCRLDWGAYSGGPRLDWEPLLKQPVPATVRAVIKRDEYFNADFSDQISLRCFKLMPPDDPDAFVYGYMPRRTPDEVRLAARLNEVPFINAEVEILPTTGSPVRRQVKILAVKKMPWFDLPAKKRPPDSGERAGAGK